jgi:CheY-like chemotaxis protein
MKILVIDDEPGVQRVLRIYLEALGFEVVTEDSAEAALASFDPEETPFVITDWTMPGMNGVELIRRIRALPGGQYVYAMLVTGRGGARSTVEGMDAGADDFLSKPFHRDELRVRVREGERIIRLERTLMGALRDASVAQPDQGPSPNGPLLRRVAESLDERIDRLMQMLLEMAHQAPYQADRFAGTLALLGELRRDVGLLRDASASDRPPPQTPEITQH